MKKSFVHGFTGLILAWTITGISYSQNSTSVAKHNRPRHEKIILLSAQLNEEKEDGSARLNEISAKAVRNFIRDYKNVSDAKWFISSVGKFVAYFISNGIVSRVFYDKKGNYEFLLRYYNEENLPYEVRHLVKSNYYDFSIYLITEFTCDNKIAYIVKIEDKTSWKTIQVVNGEMVVTEEYLKG